MSLTEKQVYEVLKKAMSEELYSFECSRCNMRDILCEGHTRVCSNEFMTQRIAKKLSERL